MQASECVVCHKTLDPVAGLFQNFWRFDRNTALYGKRKDGWFADMFATGFEGERPSATPSNGEHCSGWVKKPHPILALQRTMVAHAYYLLTGRRPLLPPESLDDPTLRFKTPSLSRTAERNRFD